MECSAINGTLHMTPPSPQSCGSHRLEDRKTIRASGGRKLQGNDVFSTKQGSYTYKILPGKNPSMGDRMSMGTKYYHRLKGLLVLVNTNWTL